MTAFQVGQDSDDRAMDFRQRRSGAAHSKAIALILDTAADVDSNVE